MLKRQRPESLSFIHLRAGLIQVSLGFSPRSTQKESNTVVLKILGQPTDEKPFRVSCRRHLKKKTAWSWIGEGPGCSETHNVLFLILTALAWAIRPSISASRIMSGASLLSAFLL